MGAEKTRKRRHADDGHQLQTNAKRPRDKPAVVSGDSNEQESRLRGGDGSDAGSEPAEGFPADSSASINKDIYYLFASDTIVCGMAEALRLPENVLQNFPAATQTDKRYGNHAKRILEGLEMRVEPPEPLEQIVRSIIQHPLDEEANVSFATAWNLLQAQKEHYATQFVGTLSGEHLDEASARALHTALTNLQAMEVLGHLRCWEGFSSDLMARLDGDRQLRVVRMEFNRLQLVMDSYVVVHGSRPQSERNAKHGTVAQKARSAWIQEDAQWTFSDPLSSVHLVVGNEHRPPASVLFQQPPNRPHTTLDDPRTINPSHVRRTTTTSSSTGPRPPPTRRPLGTMGSQQMGASTAHLEELLVDLVRKVDKMKKEAQKEFSKLSKDISSVKRHTKEGAREGQHDRPPLPPLRRLSLSLLDEYGPLMPGQHAVPCPARIFDMPGWTNLEREPQYDGLSPPRSPYPGHDPQEVHAAQQSPNYGPSSSLFSEVNPREVHAAQQSPNYGPSSSLSSEIHPQGASTPKQFPRGGDAEHEAHGDELEGGASSETGPSGQLRQQSRKRDVNRMELGRETTWGEDGARRRNRGRMRESGNGGQFDQVHVSLSNRKLRYALLPPVDGWRFDHGLDGGLKVGGIKWQRGRSLDMIRDVLESPR